MSNEGVGGVEQAVTPQLKGITRDGRAATVVGAGILVSRVTGLVRSFVFSHYFGLGLEGDAYNTAIKIPNTMRSLLGEGALSASFVPVYSRLLAKGDERGANALAGAVLGLLMMAVSVLTLAGIALAPLLTSVLASGFTGEQRQLTIVLTQIMFPMTACMVLSGWCLGVQNSHRRFFWSYASAAMWNIAQIVLLVGWGPNARSPQQLAVWLAWGTLTGSVLQVLVQLPEVLRLVRPLRITLRRTAEGVRETLSNVVPVVTALGVVQLSSFVDLQIATYLPYGAVTSLGNANAVVLLPVALFGISVAASSLPEFSRDTSGTTDYSVLLERLRGGWQRILFYIVPSTVACIAYGDLIVGLLYRWQAKFGRADQQVVHAVLAAFRRGSNQFWICEVARFGALRVTRTIKLRSVRRWRVLLYRRSCRLRSRGRCVRFHLRRSGYRSGHSAGIIRKSVGANSRLAARDWAILYTASRCGGERVEL